MLNARGELVGINTAIYQGGEGIGFAIPIDVAARVVHELIAHGEVSPVWLGVEFQDLSPERKDEICSDIAVRDVAPRFATGARFFARVRDLTSGAFWTTDEGMQDLRYVGNVPLERLMQTKVSN